MGLPVKTHKSFIDEVNLLTCGEYIVLGEYVNAKTPIKFKHTQCGYEWETTPNNFLRRHGCPKCAGNTKKTTEQYRSEIQEKYKNEFTIIGEYTGASNKILVRHNKCKYEYLTYPRNLFKNATCPKCNKKIKHTLEMFKSKVSELTGSEYTVISQNEIRNKYTKIHVKHNKCGMVFETSCHQFINKGYRCLYCAGNIKSNTELYKSIVSELCNDEYEVLGEYKNVDTPVLMKHIKCGKTFLMTPYLFKTGCRCSVCNESRGERCVSEFLDKYKVQYIKQYKIKNCKNIFSLPFDFAILKNEKLLILIEYDGVQHFKPTFGEESFNRTRLTDQIKNKYCKEHNISLLRIPYTEFNNIETILENHLKSLKII